jgi:membrane-associated protein
MDLRAILGWLRRPDELIDYFTRSYGNLTYALLGLIVFCETGLVVTPFLPGDSLLFAVGAIGMRDGSGISPVVAGAVLFCAALVGDNVNYQIGKALGPRVMKSETSRLFNKKHLEKTKAFFEKHGPKTVILARFVPIVRTFSPFVASAGAMTYRRFLVFSIIGAAAWVTTMIGAGVFFGSFEFVKAHFDAVVVMIVIISLMPMLVEYVRSRGRSPGSSPAGSSQKDSEPAPATKAV